MKKEQKDFMLASRPWPLLIAFVALMGGASPFLYKGAHGSDAEGGIGMIGASVALALFVRFLGQLRLWWLSRHLGLRVRAVWVRDQTLAISIAMKPSFTGAFSLVALRLLQAPSRSSGLLTPLEEKSIDSLPLRVNERTTLDSVFALPAGLGFQLDLYLQRACRRPVKLSLFIENKPWRHRGAVNAIETTGLNAAAPFVEEHLQATEGATHADEPYRGGEADFRRITLTTPEGASPSTRAQRQGNWLSVGSFFCWVALLAFSFLVGARELGSDEAYIITAPVALGALCLLFSGLHVESAVWSVLFGVLLIGESQLLVGVRSFFNNREDVASLLLMTGSLSMMLALLHLVLWRRKTRPSSDRK